MSQRTVLHKPEKGKAAKSSDITNVNIMRKQWAAGNRCSEPEGPGDAPSGKRVDRRQEVGWGGWGKGDERTSSAAFTSECHYFSWLSQHNKLKCLWVT